MSSQYSICSIVITYVTTNPCWMFRLFSVFCCCKQYCDKQLCMSIFNLLIHWSRLQRTELLAQSAWNLNVGPSPFPCLPVLSRTSWAGQVTGREENWRQWQKVNWPCAEGPGVKARRERPLRGQAGQHLAREERPGRLKEVWEGGQEPSGQGSCPVEWHLQKREDDGEGCIGSLSVTCAGNFPLLLTFLGDISQELITVFKTWGNLICVFVFFPDVSP